MLSVHPLRFLLQKWGRMSITTAVQHFGGGSTQYRTAGKTIHDTQTKRKRQNCHIHYLYTKPKRIYKTSISMDESNRASGHKINIQKPTVPCNVLIRNKYYWPWLVWLSGWAMTCEPKGRWFNSQSEHMPGLWARSPVWGVRGTTTDQCFSPSSSLPSPL